VGAQITKEKIGGVENRDKGIAANRARTKTEIGSGETHEN
jgi:hypothetical protein